MIALFKKLLPVYTTITTCQRPVGPLLTVYVTVCEIVSANEWCDLENRVK